MPRSSQAGDETDSLKLCDTKVMNKNLSVELAAVAIQEAQGNVSVAAKRLGICRTTFYDYINRHPSLKKVLSEARETMLDEAESVLYKAVLRGQSWAVCFFLKCQGKSRGYVERQETVSREEVAEVVTHVVRRAP